MIPIRKILCTIDLSEYSWGALHYALILSGKFNATLYVFYAIHSPRDPNYGTTEFERGSDLEIRMTKSLNQINDLMCDCAVAWKAVVRVGDPVEESIRLCSELGIDLVVAASHGITAFKRVFLGTVVERLVRHLQQPVLVVRDFKPQRKTDAIAPLADFQKIIAGCDFHPDSLSSIQLAVRFAALFDASLHLLHVLESPIHEDVVDSTEAPYGVVQEKLTQKMNERLAELLPDAMRKGVNIQTGVLTGLPAEEIIAYANQVHAGLIVVGVRNHTRFDKIIIGSSTELMLRKAPCAVLAVPPGHDRPSD